MSALGWKLVHNASVVLFLGNIITGFFWAAHARRTRDLRVIAVTFDGLIRSDRWFTLPCVLAILLSGIASAGRYGLPVMHTGWLLWSSLSFALSGLFFGVRVSPLQLRIRDLARRSPASTDGLREVDRLFLQWEVFGIVSILMAVIPFLLMMLKPSLPSL